MSLSKISKGTLIILGSGILLLILSFLDWNTASVKGAGAFGGASGSFDSAWSHGVGPLYGILLLLTLALGALIVLVEQEVVQMKLPELPVTYGQVLAGLAGLTVVFGLIRFLTHKSGAGVVSIGHTWAAWTSLILLIVLAVGAFFAFQEGGSQASKPAASK
jgi:mannose/fructose/N-acetylgalactosamine-specific phosphotransferase system component IIC